MDDQILEQITKLIAALEARRDFLAIKLGRAEEQQAHLTHAMTLFTEAIDHLQAASALESEAPLPEPVDVEVPEITVKTSTVDNDAPLPQPKRRGRPPKNGPIDRRDILVRAGRGEGVREIARKTGHHHTTIKQVLDDVQSGVADVGKAPALEADNAGSIPAPGNHKTESATGPVAPLGMSANATPIPPARLNLPKRATKPNVDPAAFVSPIPKGIDWSFELRCDSVLARICRVLAEGGPRSAVDLARGLRCALPAIDQAILRLGGYLNRLPNGNVALNTRIPGVNDQAAVR